MKTKPSKAARQIKALHALARARRDPASAAAAYHLAIRQAVPLIWTHAPEPSESWSIEVTPRKNAA